MSLKLQHISTPTRDARELINELDAELSGAYTSEQRHGLSIDKIFQPNIMFFIARLDDEAVGCGGIAFEDGFAEVKRMYVRAKARRRKIAAAILARLEQEARQRGITRLTLETGDAQQFAIRFYERAGFTRCAAFGAYATLPLQANERSVFFEKWIG